MPGQRAPCNVEAEGATLPSVPPSVATTWAMLLARIYEVFPLVCPRCGGVMRLIAFIMDGAFTREAGQGITPGLARGLGEAPVGDEAPEVFLGGLDRLEAEVRLDLPHGGRAALEEAITDVFVYFLPGFPRRCFG